MLKSNNPSNGGMNGGQPPNGGINGGQPPNNQAQPNGLSNGGQQSQTCSQQQNLNQNNNNSMNSGNGSSPTNSLTPHTPIQHPPNSATPQTPPETPENHTPPNSLSISTNNSNNNLLMGLPPSHQLSSQQLIHTQLQPHHLQSNLGPNGHHLGQLGGPLNGQMTHHLGMHPHQQLAQQQQQHQNYFKQQMSSMSPPISSWDVNSAAKVAMNNSFVNQYPGPWSYGHDTQSLLT